MSSIWQSQKSAGGASTAAVTANSDSIAELDTRLVAVEAVLQSDDVSLDELQELVDFVKANRTDLDLLSASGVLTADQVAALQLRVSDAEAQIEANRIAIASLGSSSINSLIDVNASTAKVGQALVLSASGQWVGADVALSDPDALEEVVSPDIPAYIPVAEEDPYIPVAEEDPYIPVADEVA